MRLMFLVSFAVLVSLGVSARAIATPIPNSATFGRTFFINDSESTGTELDTGTLVFSSTFVEDATYNPPGGGAVVLDSRSTIAASGAPFTLAQVDADYSGRYGVTERASATMSYQVVITGGTPGALTAVNFGTFGELRNTSDCAVCPNTSWLSASGLLRVRDPATSTDYFLLGGTTDTLFQTGLGTTPISIFTTLNLPIDVPLDVILGVTAYGYTQETYQNQALGPIVSYALLDPTFTPLEAGITVLQSSNLVPEVAPWPLLAGLFGLAVLLRSSARRGCRRPLTE